MSFAPVTKKIVAFGSKQVFLPKFTVALVRTPDLSPYHARFQVPLNFSKYDLRDYLYHAYNVKVHSIRSLVKQMPVRDTVKQPRHWFREESKKYMTVEMDKPFVWPEDPKDWEPWGKDDMEKNIKESTQGIGVQDREDQRNIAGHLRQQASQLLSGAATKKTKEDTKKTLKARSKTNKGLASLWEEQRSSSMKGKKLDTADID